MYHSISFIGNGINVNTWDDWHLIPSSRPTISPPPVKTYEVEIPGGDGSIDLTSYLLNRPAYGDRTGSFEFYVDSDFKQWTVLYSEIMAFLHGKRYKIILEDDEEYYYEGRFSVNDWKSDQNWSMITIDYALRPYKYPVQDNENPDEWTRDGGIL